MIITNTNTHYSHSELDGSQITSVELDPENIKKILLISALVNKDNSLIKDINFYCGCRIKNVDYSFMDLVVTIKRNGDVFYKNDLVGTNFEIVYPDYIFCRPEIKSIIPLE